MRVQVIVPTYNERDNLPRLVERLLRIPDLGILVVDDASPDGTGALADELAARSDGRVSVLRRSGPRGLGRAYVDGIRRALQGDAELICQMDADLSHRPEDLERMLERAADADLVIGSRYVRGGRVVNWPLRRRVLSAGANLYVRRICGLEVRDCTSGFRCWRRDALAALPIARIRSRGYAFLVQLLWEAVEAGCRITEVPIAFVEREQGASKLRLPIVLESAALPWRLAGAGSRRQPARDGHPRLTTAGVSARAAAPRS